MASNSYSVLIFLSSIVIISYIFNIFARRWKFPAVLFLLALGLLFRYVGNYFNLKISNIQPYLELFGIVGLILIVFEAALDIKINSSSVSIVRKSLEVAFLVLILEVIAIASLFHFWLLVDWRVAYINSIPLAVISSAIVIPSVTHLSYKKKEFLIYESTLSDILGILLFSFLIQHVMTRLANLDVLLIGSLVIVILHFIGYLYLKLVARIDPFPELFIAPKGLVSILLFYSIPAQSVIPYVSRGVLFLSVFPQC